MAKQIPIGAISLLETCQAREHLDPLAVEEYREIYKAGGSRRLPAIECVNTGPELILYNGFHRFAAAQAAGLKFLDIEEKRGTADDAVYLAIAANKTHGVRRTNEDKRKAVRMALNTPKLISATDRAIAEHVGVSHTLVASIRKEVATSLGVDVPQKREGRDGRTYSMPPKESEPESTGNVASGEAPEPRDEETAEELIERHTNVKAPSTKDYESAIHLLQSVRSAMSATCKSTEDQVFCRVADVLKAQEEAIRDAAPVVCPVCEGVGCERCKSKGVVTARAARTLQGVAA